MKIIVMGVSGSGKTTVGRAIARCVGGNFHDADDFHPAANIEKMSRGLPLDDADRQPWLERLNALLRESAGCVLACSALKRRYRAALTDGIVDGVRFVYLRADAPTIMQRMASRSHFFPPELLQSQFDALEEPGQDEAIIVDATLPSDQVVAAIAERL